MNSCIPTDVARIIAKRAIELRNEEIMIQIATTVVEAFDCAISGKCTWTEKRLFEGASKCLHITDFFTNGIFWKYGVEEFVMKFFLYDESFKYVHLKKLTPTGPGPNGETNFHDLFVNVPGGKYASIVKSVFLYMFPDGKVHEESLAQ
jgi:hypothetical protein